jgi:hypothetical protein
VGGKSSIALNVVAAVVHARRTRLLDGRASGESPHIGIIAVAEELIRYPCARCFSRVAEDFKRP